MKRHLHRLAAGLVVVSLTACSGGESAPDEAEGSRLPRLAAPDHYTLVITPDLATATFTGEATIDIRVLQRTPRIILHAAEITVGRATVEAAGRTQDASVTLDAEDQTATLTVREALAPGPARIAIAYTGILNDQLRGLYLSQANGRRYAVTQLEATDARRMYPSFDEPAMKATFDLTAIIDEGDEAISNGAIVSDTPGPVAGKRTIRFSRTPKMSSYLVALVVGDFDCASGGADGIPIRICSTPDKKALTGMALRMTEDLMRYFNQYFAIKYPFGKLDIVAVPDFAAGAMENAGAIFYRESMLLAAEAEASLGVRKTIAMVLAHEIAHHWFGNLVTMDWWNDIWLNEGFATWMETRPFRTMKPEWHVELDEVRTSLEAMDVDRLHSTRPIRNPANTPDEINEVFDAIAYSKGAATLRMLEAWLGEERFRQAINAYLAKFQYANARGEDFWTTVAASAGLPVDRVMSSFVDQPGVPVLTVATSCQSGTMSVNLAQTRYRELGRPSTEASPAWNIPICLRGPEAGGASCHVLAAPADRLSLPACQPWIFANRQGSGYYRTAYEPAALSLIIKNSGSLSSAERIMLASDVWAAVRAGTTEATAFLDLAEALRSDRTSAMVGVLAEPLDFIGTYLTTDASRPPYQAWLRRVFGPVLNNLGWAPRRGEPEDIGAVRASLVGLLGATGNDPQVQARARTLALNILDKRGRVDPTLGNVVLPLAASRGDAALYDRFLEAYRKATSPDDRQRYLLALGAFTDPALVRRTIDLALSPDVRTQDAGRLLARAVGAEGGMQRAWPLIRDRWSDVSKRVNPFFGMMNLIQSLGSGCLSATAAEVKTFFDAHPVVGVERTLQQTLERIESCAVLARQQTAPLATRLAGR
jgi:aminopeptidase N